MAKESAFGANFQIDIAATLTTIAQVKDIQGPDVTIDTIDVTTHDSTGQWEEHIAGVKRSGNITLELEYDTANAQVVSFISQLGDAISMKIQFSNAAADEMTFTGIPVGISHSLPHDGSITSTLTVKPTGAITFPS